MEAFEQSAGRIAQAMGAAARSVAPSAPIMLGEIIRPSRCGSRPTA